MLSTWATWLVCRLSSMRNVWKAVLCAFMFMLELYCFSPDVDECTSGEHHCDEKSESCRNMPGSFTCDCRKGFRRDGDKCVKKKGKKKTQKDSKTKEQELEEDLEKGNYFSGVHMKLGSVLYAVFFACVVAAVMKRSRLAIVLLTLVYGCILWFLRR